MKYFFSSTKQELFLEDLVGRGSGAAIYRIKNDVSLVAKIYHNPSKVPLEKLEYMLSNPPDDPEQAKQHISLAWIHEEIVDESDRVMGYLMPRIENGLPIHRLYTPRERRLDFPGVDWGVLHRSAQHLARTMAAIHAKSYVIGDLHETNILVQPGGLVSFIDIDLFQVTNLKGKVFRCPSGKPEYLAPELQGKALATIDRNESHDLFALGVLIFYLLMEGTHPFQGSGEPRKLSERIRQGLYPYDLSQKPSYQAPVSSPPFEVLHPKVQMLFQRCLAAGQNLPEQRPKAEEWADTLDAVEKELISCKDSTTHLYFRHGKRCSWCERKSMLKGRDPFPALQQARQLPGQQALPEFSDSTRKFPIKDAPQGAHGKKADTGLNAQPDPQQTRARRHRLRNLILWLLLFNSIVVAVPSVPRAIQRVKRRRTIADMQEIGAGLEAYKRQEKSYPPAPEGTIFSSYLLPLDYYSGIYRDRWKTSFRYVSDGETYRLISYGKDKTPGEGSKSAFDADLVLENGRFLEYTDELPPLTTALE